MTDSIEPELSFPCEYPVRVIGKDEDDFAAFVMEVVSHHVPDLAADMYTIRPSSKGKYISVAVTFIAESRAQVDGLYHELGSHPRVLVAL